MNARKKEGRSARKKSHFKVQAMRTAQNKSRQNLKRKRRIGIKQPRAKIGTCLGGYIVARDWNTAKQSRRKARNIQRQNRYKQTKAAAELVLPVEEATAE